MSNHRAIAAVTATIRNMLQAAVSADPDLVGAAVTTRPPDRARQGAATANQMNLFLYRTSIDAAWRNQDAPGVHPGESGHPPLPLVLSYLLTAYGEDDDELKAHRLLGVGMQVLNSQPLLFAADLAAALTDNSGAPAPSGVEGQPDRVRITPHPIPMDEISRLWATFGTGYRISASYDAAVVLIDDTRPVVASLPVLARSAGDVGPNVVGQVAPVILSVTPPSGQRGARPGDTVTIGGQGLGAVSLVRLSGGALSAPQSLPVAAAPGGAVTFQLPPATSTTPPPLPAGIVGVTALVPAGDQVVPSNMVALSLVPVLTNTTPLTGTLVNGQVTANVACVPPVLASQSIALVVGTKLVTGGPPAGVNPPWSSLPFTVNGLPAGTYVLRLRIDGQDSIPSVAGQTAFDPNQMLVLS